MADLPQEPTAQILYQMLEDTHPKMVEALHQAAISPWYDLPFFMAVRAEDDGRNEALLPCLSRYSFVVPLNRENGSSIYGVRPDERDWLQRHWIGQDPAAFQAAHQRAYTYRHTHPDPLNPDAHAQNELYHLFFADFEAALNRLTDLFRIYFTERRLAAMERLLATAAEARTYLSLLNQTDLHRLDNLLIHLNTRLAQRRGQWQESLEPLRGLLKDPNLAHDLVPNVIRAYGLALSQTGQHVEAIEQLKLALSEFEQRAATAEQPYLLQAELGYTMIALGDAYVALAAQAQGYKQNVSVLPFGYIQILRDAFNFFISLPLACFLTLTLGYRVWLPQFWPVYERLDWIIARLFATAARYYKKADPLLESDETYQISTSRAGIPNLEYIPQQEAVFADEKLALLYLQMGAYHQARELFDYLLSEQEAPLGEFRRASVRVGLAQALIHLDEAALAQAELERAMMILEFYEEPDLQAVASTVWGQALLAGGATADTSAITTAITHLSEAIQLHQAQNQWVKATEVSEYLLALTRDDTYELTAEQKKKGQQKADLPQRHYPVPYRNAVTSLFRRLVFLILAIMVFFIMPMSSIKMDISTSVIPRITFQARPLMEGVTALNLAESDVLIDLGAQLFFGYLLLSTGLGLLAMLFTPLRRVQEAGEAQVIRLDERGLQVGKDRTQNSINWDDATRYIQADVRLFNSWLPDASYSVLQAGLRSIFIGGSTAWYPSLRDRIAAQLPPETEQIRLSHAIVRSRLGLVFVLTAVLLLTISLMGSLTPQLVSLDWLGPYSLADFYPYVYLGFFVPMGWWFIAQPLRKRWWVEPATTPAYWAGGIGLLLAILRLATQFRPWLTIPDIYPDLLILILVTVSSIILWRARHPNGRPVQPPWLRLGAVITSAIICLFMLAHTGQVVLAYHYLTTGNHFRDEALTQPEQSTAAWQAYQRSVDIAEIKLLGLMSTHTPGRTPGIPQPHEFIWLQAQNGKAAMSSQLGDYETAIITYTNLLSVTDEQAKAYAGRAIAYQGMAAARGGQTDAYIRAIADYNEAIRRDSTNADYYLWRGVAYHSLGIIDQAAIDYLTALDETVTDGLRQEGRSQALSGLRWLQDR